MYFRRAYRSLASATSFLRPSHPRLLLIVFTPTTPTTPTTPPRTATPSTHLESPLVRGRERSAPVKGGACPCFQGGWIRLLPLRALVRCTSAGKRWCMEPPLAACFITVRRLSPSVRRQPGVGLELSSTAGVRAPEDESDAPLPAHVAPGA
ncbi:hypothetical protein DFH06DRAFT_1344719 [Mycena polygramma]|nr:hypothetical protein DFH06DRAFT_1344719 [Mycena polygramma]